MLLNVKQEAYLVKSDELTNTSELCFLPLLYVFPHTKQLLYIEDGPTSRDSVKDGKMETTRAPVEQVLSGLPASSSTQVPLFPPPLWICPLL